MTVLLLPGRFVSGSGPNGERCDAPAGTGSGPTACAGEIGGDIERVGGWGGERGPEWRSRRAGLMGGTGGGLSGLK